MITKVKLLLGITDTYQDNLLELLIDNAKSFAVSYCRLGAYTTKLDNIIPRMVVEDYNRMGGEGTDNQSFGGLNETYATDYSDQVYSMLKAYRRIKIL